MTWSPPTRAHLVTSLVMFSSLTLVSMVLIHSAQRKGGFRHSVCFFLLTDSRWVTFTFFVSST